MCQQYPTHPGVAIQAEVCDNYYTEILGVVMDYREYTVTFVTTTGSEPTYKFKTTSRMAALLKAAGIRDRFENLIHIKSVVVSEK